MLSALKDYRTAQGLTQNALAKVLGVHSITISRWETGQRQIDRELVPKVSEVTGIAPRQLRPDWAETLEPAQ